MENPLDLLAEKYEFLLEQLETNAPLPVFQNELQRHPTNNGDAHVEVVDGALNYVVTERGCELHRRIARNEDELLYWLMDDVTSSIAWRLRRSLLSMLRRQDPRQQRFERHIKLLTTLRPEWGATKKQHYDELLKRYPYRTKS
ncbi:MAG: Imm63 family immunity protein [Dokdonella sp.]|uniref:Imm63 family immunity protein n=1 Tax=Dokdonella sp. TaxID=2291710 RepID=UPI0032638DB2